MSFIVKMFFPASASGRDYSLTISGSGESFEKERITGPAFLVFLFGSPITVISAPFGRPRFSTFAGILISFSVLSSEPFMSFASKSFF